MSPIGSGGNGSGNRSRGKRVAKDLAVHELAIASRENFAARLRHDNRVLELGRQRSIRSHRCPLVVEHFDFVTTQVDHRLDGKTHAGSKSHALATFAHVRNLRSFVELTANAVSDERANDGTTFALGKRLNRRSNVAETRAFPNFSDGELEGSTRNFRYVLGFGRRFTDVERGGCVPEEPFEDRRNIDIDDVPRLEHSPTWNAMTNDLVDRCAHALGKTVVI